MGIDSVLTGANASLELEGHRVAWFLADQLRGLLDLHRERIRGHVAVAADEEAKEVRLEREDGEARTLRVGAFDGGGAKTERWELATGAGPGAVRPGPIAAYLAEWLRG